MARQGFLLLWRARLKRRYNSRPFIRKRTWRLLLVFSFLWLDRRKVVKKCSWKRRSVQRNLLEAANNTSLTVAASKKNEVSFTGPSTIIQLQRNVARWVELHKDNLRHLPRFPDFFVTFWILSPALGIEVSSNPFLGSFPFWIFFSWKRPNGWLRSVKRWLGTHFLTFSSL